MSQEMCLFFIKKSSKKQYIHRTFNKYTMREVAEVTGGHETPLIGNG